MNKANLSCIGLKEEHVRCPRDFRQSLLLPYEALHTCGASHLESHRVWEGHRDPILVSVKKEGVNKKGTRKNRTSAMEK